jgi:hypothetical protein
MSHLTGIRSKLRSTACATNSYKFVDQNVMTEKIKVSIAMYDLQKTVPLKTESHDNDTE